MSVLDSIIDGVRLDLAERQAAQPMSALESAVSSLPAPLDPMPDFRSGPVSVIAEVKRSSPSKGALADIADPAALALDYEAGGASAISVLTEGRRFGGSLEDLRAVRAAVEIPVLRKDFIVTDYQLWEARAAGADLALLIVAALAQPDLVRLHTLARTLGLTPLVEVHDAEEVERALDAGADLVGVNSRNLKTLDVDPDTFGRLSGRIPEGVVRVAESGIRNPEDVRRFVGEGAHVVLVGEALVTTGDPRGAIAAMRGGAA